MGWLELLRHRQTWAFIAGMVTTSPIWWFYLYWVPGFLHDKYGLNLTQLGPPLIVIYLIADVGSVGGGWLSSALIKRGTPVGRARKIAMLVCAVAVVPVFAAALTTSTWVATVLIGVAAAAHQGFAANLYTLVSDTAPRHAVSSIVGIGGMAAGLSGMLNAKLVGYLLDWTHNYLPVFILASCTYLVALALIHRLNPRHESLQLPAISRTMALEWKSDDELFALIRRELYTPVVGDVLDALGKFHQFLPAPVQPLRENMVVAGRAMPVLMIDVHGPQQKPFGLLTEALDDLKPGEVYVCGGGAQRCAYWGELLTATARTRGAVGAVIDGYHRDTPKVLEQNWPVFSRGRYAQDSAVRTAVTQFRCPIEIGGVWIEPGDLVFGDLDGVVIVPRALEEQVIPKALEKARGEKLVRKAIEGGMSATAAFKKFGIL